MSAMDRPDISQLYTDQLIKEINSPHYETAFLKAMCNRKFEKELLGGGNTVRITTIAPANGIKKKFSDRVNTDPIGITKQTLNSETITVNQTFEYRDFFPYTMFDKESQVESLTKTFIANRKKGWEQECEIDVTSNFIYANIHNVITGAETTANGAVTAGATTITVTDGTNFSAGDILLATATDGKTFGAYVKSKATHVITIETDPALFPKGGVNGDKEFFGKLVTALPAVADGAVVKGDKPIQVSKTTFYDLLVDLKGLPRQHSVPMGDDIFLSSDKPFSLLHKDDSTILKNDSFGENLLLTGETRRLLGAEAYVSGNSPERTVAGVKRYYIPYFKKNHSFHFIDWLNSFDIQKPAGYAGTVLDVSALHIYQSAVTSEEAKSIAWACVYI